MGNALSAIGAASDQKGTTHEEFANSPIGDLSAANADKNRRIQVAEGFGRLPLNFEPNRGQTDPRAQYLTRGRGYTLFLTSDEMVLSLRERRASGGTTPAKGPAMKPSVAQEEPARSNRTVVRVNLVGANRAARLVGLDELPGKSNYFIGNDPAKWRTNVPNYRKVAMKGVYPGIDLVYYGQHRELEYDFNVAPGTDPGAIRFNIEGAEDLRIDSTGDLLVSVPGGELRMHKPVVYQEIAQVRQPIPGSFVLTGDREVGG